jgi:hypothetical protein
MKATPAFQSRGLTSRIDLLPAKVLFDPPDEGALHDRGFFLLVSKPFRSPLADIDAGEFFPIRIKNRGLPMLMLPAAIPAENGLVFSGDRGGFGHGSVGVRLVANDSFGTKPAEACRRFAIWPKLPADLHCPVRRSYCALP